MGENIRSTLAQTTKTLVPEWSYLPEFRQSKEAYKESQKENYDTRHRVRNLPEIPSDTAIFINTSGNVTAGRTVSMADTPRSYIVENPQWTDYINIDPNHSERDRNSTQQRSPIITRSQSGTDIHPPGRLA